MVLPLGKQFDSFLKPDPYHVTGHSARYSPPRKLRCFRGQEAEGLAGGSQMYISR